MTKKSTKAKKKPYKKTGRKLSKSPSNSPLMRSIRRRAGEGVSGHGNIRTQQLTREQRIAIKDKGGTVVKLKHGPKKRITPGNVFSDGRIEYYKRSGKGRKKTAVRRPGSDKKRSASHKGTTKKPMMGD